MADYVVDTSVVIQHFITDIYSANADRLFDQLDSTLNLYVPEFCLLECANVIWKRVRFHGMPQPQAESLITDLIGLPMTIMPAAGLLKRGLQIGLRNRIAVYDSVYIALAEYLQRPLITVDIGQERAAKLEGVSFKIHHRFCIETVC